ncbi:MAG: DNA-binding response regulator [Fluviicola sp. XM-24bin1]|nr:MAG: DNA-binding response regulator [Fluviicola sp. XM-24bin1]
MKAFIIDDEEHPRVLLRYLLKENNPEVEVVGEASNLVSGIRRIHELGNIDVLFLDIEMPENDGLEIKKLYPGDINFEIVFITAYNQYAIQAIKLSALDYLLKPLNEDRLSEAILRLKERVDEKRQIKDKLEILSSNLTSKNQKLFIKTTKGERHIILSDILYLKADGMYTHIHGKGGDLMASKPLKEIAFKLPDYFFRCHRSYVVNTKNVSHPILVNVHGILLENGQHIPVSSQQKSALLDLL